LPVLFLLAKSLFKSDLAGLIAVSLYVLSPYFHFYVHEARYNIFLVFLISLFHYLFLKAIELKKLKWWIGYSLVGILALYASVISGILLSGHIIYVLFFKKDIKIVYGINLLIILSCYLPWIISMINNNEEITGSLAWHIWYGKDQNFLKLLMFQFSGFIRIFTSLSSHFDYLFALREFKFTGVYTQLIADIVILIILILSVIYTINRAPGRVALFLVLIVLPHILFYFISDLIRNAGGSIIWRYHAINYVGIILFVACLLNGKIAMGKLFYSGIYISLIIAGLISILIVSGDRCYHIPLNCEQNINEAELFSKADHPLLISDYSMLLNIGTGGFFTILNRCESENIDVLHASYDIENLEEMIAGKDYSEIYVTHASDELVENLKSQFGERMDSLEIEGIDPMWQIYY
jgi:hypothetical protein